MANEYIVMESPDGRALTKVPRLDVVKEGWRENVSYDGVHWTPHDSSPDQDGSVSHWDFLPPEMQELILKEKEKMEIQDNIKNRLVMGWDKIHLQMDQLPRCRVHRTVSSRFFMSYHSS